MTVLPWLALLAGCETVVRFPPDLWAWDSGRWRDTGFEPTTGDDPLGALQIDHVQWGCDGQYDDLDVWIQTSARAFDGEVTLYADTVEPGWREVHHLDLVTELAEIGVDRRRAGPLHHGADPALSWVPNQSTALHCADDVPTMSLVVRVYGEGLELADCAMWNPTEAVLQDVNDDPDLVALGGCTLLLGAP